MKPQGSRLGRAPKLIQYCVGAILCSLLAMLQISPVQGLPEPIPNVANLSESTQPLEEPERGVYVVGTTAYLADKERGLRIFDVSDPLHPVQLNQQLIADGAQEVHVMGNYAYIVNGGAMRIINVADPRNPVEVPNGVYAPHWAWDVYVDGQIAYVAAWRNDAQLVDVTNVSNPTYIRSLPVAGDNRAVGVEVKGNRAFVVDNPDKGVRIWDITNPANAQSVGLAIVTSGKSEKTFVENDRLYVASSTGGINIFDLSAPTFPIGQHDTPGYARDVYVLDDIAYVADQEGGVRVIDVSIPSQPKEIKSYKTPGNAMGIYGEKDWIFVADSVAGLFVIPHEYGPRPLPGHSGNVGPPGSTDPADLCCMAGYVYWNGTPVYTPTVMVSDKYGNSAAAISHDATYPHYYSLDLTNRTDLNIQIGDTITLTAKGANTSAQTIPYVVKGGPQQVDIVITASSTYTRPIATVNRRSHVNKADVNDMLIFEGSGQDSDETVGIAAYEWRSNKVAATLSTSSTLQIEPYQLTEGQHNLTFRVQDTEGQWSQPVLFALDLIKSVDGWTILLYLAGDYEDNNYLGWQFGNAKANFEQIKSKLPAGVNVLLLKDDRAQGERELEVYSSSPTTTTAIAERLCTGLQGEIQMDKPETLTNFLSCGQRLFTGTHYYLSIADHGHGILGTAWDYSSPPITIDGQSYPNYLETKEIDDAIRNSTGGKVDILHLDSCSMNLLETAHEVHDVADYLISSQFLTWADFSYYNYIRDLDGEESPQEYAFTVANRYVQSVPSSLPYTISVLKLDNYPKVHGALDELATELLRQIDNGSLAATTLDGIRRNVQVLESEYTDEKYGHEPELDFYIDLTHWATLIRSTVTIPSVQQKADLLLATLARTSGFTIKNAVRSGVMPGSLGGATIDVSNAQGVSIFYPLQDRRKLLASYVNHRLFTFTEKSMWDELLKKLNPTIGAPRADAPLLAPFAPLEAPHQIFLPLVNR